MNSRKNSIIRWTGLLACAILSANIAPSAQACTGVRLIAADGSVVYARTLEFGKNLQSNVLMVPRGYERTGETPDGSQGLRWKAKYASLGANGVGLPYIFDGLNEKGLAAGTFYFPGTAAYMKYDPSMADKTLSSWQFNSWILDNFATVDELKAGIEKIVIPAVMFKAWDMVLPVHYVVHDAAGKCIVIEPVDGRLQVYDNRLGVITNAPTFDWHMTNLRNYVNLSPINASPRRLGPIELESFGQGSGMLGLPGDFTPPSRFVRAAEYSQSVYKPAAVRDAVLQAFHILNNFDIPKGAARDRGKAANGNPPCDYTQWTSANDLQAKQFYFRTHDNSRIRMVDLMKMKLDAKDTTTISMQGDEEIEILNPATGSPSAATK